MMQLSVRAQSIAKPEGEFAPTIEDAIRVDEQAGCFALSDGAGGMGVFAGQWAQYLLQQLPPDPVCDFAALKQWQNDIWQPYFERTKAELQAAFEDALPKLYAEGSSATLAAAWMDRGSASARVLAYGDAVCLHFSEGTYALLDANLALCDFLRNPFLLNCNNEPLPNGYWQAHWQLAPGDILLLASDAMGLYLLGLYALLHPGHAGMSEQIRTVLQSPFRPAVLLDNQQGRLREHPATTWAQVLEDLWNALEREADFREYTNTQLEAGLLGLDDYSVIMIRMGMG